MTRVLRRYLLAATICASAQIVAAGELTQRIELFQNSFVVNEPLYFNIVFHNDTSAPATIHADVSLETQLLELEARHKDEPWAKVDSTGPIFDPSMRMITLEPGEIFTRLVVVTRHPLRQSGLFHSSGNWQLRASYVPPRGGGSPLVTAIESVAVVPPPASDARAADIFSTVAWQYQSDELSTPAQIRTQLETVITDHASSPYAAYAKVQLAQGLILYPETDTADIVRAQNIINQLLDNIESTPQLENSILALDSEIKEKLGDWPGAIAAMGELLRRAPTYDNKLMQERFLNRQKTAGIEGYRTTIRAERAERARIAIAAHRAVATKDTDAIGLENMERVGSQLTIANDVDGVEHASIAGDSQASPLNVSTSSNRAIILAAALFFIIAIALALFIRNWKQKPSLVKTD